MEIKFIATIAIALLNIFLGYYILRKNYKNPGNFNYAGLCFSGGLWALSMAGLLIANSQAWLDFDIKLTYIFGIFTPMFFLLFAYHYPYKLFVYPKWLISIIYFFSAFFVFLVSLGLFRLEDSLLVNNRVEQHAIFSNFLIFALYFFFYIIWGLIILIIKFKNIEGVYRVNIKYLILATLSTFIITGLTSVIMPVFGSFAWDWLGPIFTSLNLLAVGFLIFQDFFANLRSKLRGFSARINPLQKICLVFFAFLLIFYFILNFYVKTTTGFYNYLFSFTYSLAPLILGFLSIFFMPSWNWLTTSIGKAVFFISLGLFSWGFGSMTWSYYNFFQNISAPYPSLADIGFSLAYIFWIIGIINLLRASGVSAALIKAGRRYLLIAIPIIVFAFSYYLLVNVARGGLISASFNDHLKLFFDLYYPIGDVTILSIALIIFSLPAAYIHGKYKLVIFSLLFGFAVMYFADFVFSYTTTLGVFYNGSYVDLLFATGLLTISFGCLGFKREKTED